MTPSPKTPQKKSASTLYLQEYFLECTRKNPQFSLRAFAKKLEITPSGLSQILSGKKRLSFERAHDFAKKLSLSESETEYFLLQVQADGAKSAEIKANLLEKIETAFPEKTVSQNLTIDQFKMISEWYGIAVLEVVSVMGPDWSSEKIATYLEISKTEVELMLARLERLEFIEKTTSGYKRTTDRIEIQSGIPDEAIRNFYKNCLPKIEASITGQSPKEKVIGAEYFAFDPTCLEEVRKETDAYFERLMKIAKKGKKKTEVYQAFVNVYRMNQKIPAKKSGESK